MAKKLRITEIVTTAGSVYTIGVRPVHFGQGDAVVESIQCNRSDNAYNKGFQVPGASYTVKLSDNEVRVVPFHAVGDVGAKWIDEAALDAVPDLPEA